MKITESARDVIVSVIKTNNFDAVKMYTKTSCCGNSIGFELLKLEEGQTAEMIDGVPAFVDEETMAWTEDVIIDTQDGNLTLINPNAGCGSCGGSCH